MIRRIAFAGIFGVYLSLGVVINALAGQVTFLDLGASNDPTASNALGTSHAFVDDHGNSINAQGFYLHKSEWTTADLWQRNQPTDDVGLGICNPNEQGNCGNATGTDWHGDYNELSNEQGQELIQLTLPSNMRWVSITLSSLDNNGGGWNPVEHGVLIASDNAITNGDTTPSISQLLGSTNIIKFQAGDDNTLDLSGSNFASSPYLFLIAYDWTTNWINCSSNYNNDYLIKSAALVDPVPEPATLLLFGMGLLALGFLRCRRLPASA